MEAYLFLTLAGLGWMLSNRGRGSQVAAEVAATAHAQPVRVRYPEAARGDVPSVHSLYDASHVDEVRAGEARAAAHHMRHAQQPVQRHAQQPVQPAASEQQGVFVSPLTGVAMSLDDFTHNNMVPFFGGSLKQNTSPDAFSSRLETFSGAGGVAAARPKDAQGPRFALQAQDLSFGTAGDAQRSAFLGTFQPSRNQAFTQPAPQWVGRPGVAGGATGDVYYDQRAALRVKTVDELRPLTRPRVVTEGRVLPGMGTTVDRPDVAPSGRVLLPRMREQRPEDMLRGRAAATAPATRSAVFVAPTARAQTGCDSRVGGAGGGAIPARPNASRGAEPRVPFRAPTCGPAPGPLAAPGARVDDYGRAAAATQVPATSRETTGARSYAGMLTAAVKALIVGPVDPMRGTRKEELADAPRAYGNLGVGPGAVAQPKLTVYDTQDVARTTLRETGLAPAPLLNVLGGAQRGAAREPDAAPGATLRETLDVAADPARNPARAREAGPVADPDAWRAAPTRRDVVAATHGCLDGTGGAIGGLQGARGGAYALSEARGDYTQRAVTDDVPRPVGGAAPASGAPARGGYAVAEVSAPDTLRQGLSDTDYYGGAQGEARPTSDAAASAMGVRGDREAAVVGADCRAPTAVGANAGLSQAALGAAAGLGTQRDDVLARQDARAAIPDKAVPGPGPAEGESRVADAMGCLTSERPYLPEDRAAARFLGDVAGAAQQRLANPLIMAHMSDSTAQ